MCSRESSMCASKECLFCCSWIQHSMLGPFDLKCSSSPVLVFLKSLYGWFTYRWMSLIKIYCYLISIFVKYIQIYFIRTGMRSVCQQVQHLINSEYWINPHQLGLYKEIQSHFFFLFVIPKLGMCIFMIFYLLINYLLVYNNLFHFTDFVWVFFSATGIANPCSLLGYIFMEYLFF